MLIATFFRNGVGTTIDVEGGKRNPAIESHAICGSENSLGADAATQLQDDKDGMAVYPQSDEEEDLKKKFGIRDRISCYTWTWFNITTSAAGIANVLHSIPYRSEWLRVLGVVIFLFNVAIFLNNCVLITLRFRWNPGSFRSSFTSPSESLFISTSLVSVGMILTNMSQYGIPETGPWFQTVMQICFWVYACLSFITSAGMYLIIWSTHTFPIHSMTPAWILPAYPLLLVGPLASTIINAMPDSAAATRVNAVTIAFGGVCIQGTGFLVSLMINSAFVYRLMTQKLPHEKSRPGLFVSVGSGGTTATGLVGLGTSITKLIPDGYEGSVHIALLLKLISDLVGICIWGLCVWFFLISLGAHWQMMLPIDKERHIEFEMTWFAFIFPNTALITATLAIGNSLESHAINIFGTVLASMITVLWILIFVKMIRSLIDRRLLWPGEMDGCEISWRKWISKF